MGEGFWQLRGGTHGGGRCVERSLVSAAGWGGPRRGWGWRRGGSEQGQAWHGPPGIHKPLQKRQEIFLRWAGLPEGVMFKLRPLGGPTRPGEEQVQRPRACRGRGEKDRERDRQL